MATMMVNNSTASFSRRAALRASSAEAAIIVAAGWRAAPRDEAGPHQYVAKTAPTASRNDGCGQIGGRAHWENGRTSAVFTTASAKPVDADRFAITNAVLIADIDIIA